MRTKNTHIQPKIRQQIILIFLLATILPITILSCFCTRQVRRQMLEQYKSQIHADGIRVKSILFDLTTSMYTSVNSILNNKNCMELFSSDYTTQKNIDQYKDIDNRLDNLMQNNPAISSIHIYTDNPSIPDSLYISSLKNYKDQSFWHTINENTWITWSCCNTPTTHNLNSLNYELTFIRRIGITSQKYTAYLVLSFDNNYLKNRLEQNNFIVTLCLDDYPVFYSSRLDWIQQPMPAPDDFNGGFYTYSGYLDIAGEKMLANILTFQPNKTNNKFYINIYDPMAYKNLTDMTLLYLVIILIAILVPTALILMFSSYFSKRVATLKTVMHQASQGNYNIIATFSGDDELSETFEDLKTCVEQIHRKESVFYETQLKTQQLINKQQQMEFKMLTSQINPHFLYNTLETIRMQALASGNKAVATSIKLLGKSMHYVLENTGKDMTSLAEELSYIKTYLAIQQLRFGDRVNAVFHIPEDMDLNAYKILPLLIQPIVENSIVHGLEGVNENGYITISIDPQEDFLIITIEDNGNGMDTATLNKLRDHIEINSLNDTNNIGLYNINKRIKLFYGKKYSLKITSVLNKGTTVTLKLPQIMSHN